MDNTIVLYLIKSSIALALFYGLYMLFLRKDTLFGVRRVYFLFAIVFSIVYPLCTIEFSILQETDSIPPIYAYWLSQIEISETEIEYSSNSVIDFWLIVKGMIVGVSVFLILRFFVQIFSIIKLRIKNKSYKVSSCRIVRLDSREITPFSFFNWIFLNEEFHDNEKLKEIIAHEHIHVHQWHSIDVILSELICIVFWWNPFAWLLRNEMKLNLEYLADQGVLNAGFNSKEYQYILLKVSNINTGIPIINNFNVSQLKKRIAMMNKKRTSMISVAKYMMCIPLSFVLLLGNVAYASPAELMSSTKNVFNNEVEEFFNMKPEWLEDRVSSDVKYTVAEPEVMQDKPKKGNQEPYNIVEVMPAFVGGEDAMMKFLTDNLKYPADALDAGVHGRVSIRFVVTKTGEVSNAEIIRGFDPSCDKEALRVVSSMPKWNPGKQRGENVDVYYNLPIVFRLPQESKGEVKETAPTQNKKSKSSGEETPPTFPKGDEALAKFVTNNLKYPAEALKAGIHGRVIIRFVVAKTGEISNAEIAQGIDPLCDKEALRVVNLMPKWNPGKLNGEAVDMNFTLPIVFRYKDK